MRRSDSSLPPAVEGLVFALALLLALILIFYGARSLLARRSRAQLEAAGGGSTSESDAGQASGAVPAPRAAVCSIPPIKVSVTGSPRTWRVEVPTPAETKKK